MEPNPSLLDKILSIGFAYWPYVGLLLGPILIITNRFRWRVLCQSLGVIIMGIAIGALVSKS